MAKTVELEVAEAVRALTERWPSANWTSVIDRDPGPPMKGCWISITGTIGGVKVCVEATAKNEVLKHQWEAQVEGSLKDWTKRWDDPVEAMNIAIGNVRDTGKIWEKLSTGLSEKDRNGP